MNTKSSQYWQDADKLASELFQTHHGQLVVAMPLGLGKANHIINALYSEAQSNPAYSLKILTALSLQTPQPKSTLEQAFFEPILERVYAGYTELAYARDLAANQLAKNVEVIEFFLQAGAYLGNPHAQQNYISANYSHASSYLLELKIDVVIQMVAQRSDQQNAVNQFSLSCNPDITLELLHARDAGEVDFQLIGEVNDQLPFMAGDAQLEEAQFSQILQGECRSASLFSVPKVAIGVAEYAAGFHASSLIKDGGTLQLGIGAGADAVAYALIMRQTDNRQYKAIIAALDHQQSSVQRYLEPFEQGLYGVSEMLVDVFLDLLEAGILKREINGTLLHAGFFLGPNSLYRRLREMPQAQREKINMTEIGYINGTHIDFKLKQQNRQHARFINNAMKATLLGAVVSDALDSGQVVSGVGGQYDFVRQAFALHGARSIIMLKAIRTSSLKPSSNIVWQYGHTTIPRHLRDILVSEYGIADLRGASDHNVVAQMLSISDQRFQAELLGDAKANHKIDAAFELDPRWSNNCHTHLRDILAPFQMQGLLPDYPFGSDFSELEQQLIPLLQSLKVASKSKWRLSKLAIKGLFTRLDDPTIIALERLGMRSVSSASERILRLILIALLDQATTSQQHPLSND